MGEEKTLIFIGYAVMPLASLWFFFVAFGRKYRSASQWIRSVNLILAIIGLIWSTLGFLLLFYSSHLTSRTRSSLFDWKSHISGIAVGLLISLLLSSEGRELGRRSRRSNKSLEPTAGRRDAHI
jgi:membrane associated rhomboid family serine protease